MAVSLRIPEDVKRRVDRLAGASDTTAHAFMLEAIRDKVEADEARAAFHLSPMQAFCTPMPGLVRTRKIRRLAGLS